MRTLRISILAGLGLLVAACGAPIDEPADDPVTGEEGPEDRSDDEANGTTQGAQVDLGLTCENPQDGYRIDHPTGWHVNDGEVTAPCRVFDVEPPTIEPDTVLPLASSGLLTVEDHDLDAMRDLIAADPATDVDELDVRREIIADMLATLQPIEREQEDATHDEGTTEDTTSDAAAEDPARIVVDVVDDR